MSVRIIPQVEDRTKQVGRSREVGRSSKRRVVVVVDGGAFWELME